MKTNEVTELRRRVDAERRVSGNRAVRYSAELRRDMLALLEGPEWTQTGLASATGISASVIQNWRKATTPRKSEGSLQRVYVTPPQAPSEELELVFPSGARVRGLTLAQVAALLDGHA